MKFDDLPRALSYLDTLIDTTGEPRLREEYVKLRDNLSAAGHERTTFAPDMDLLKTGYRQGGLVKEIEPARAEEPPKKIDPEVDRQARIRQYEREHVAALMELHKARRRARIYRRTTAGLTSAVLFGGLMTLTSIAMAVVSSLSSWNGTGASIILAVTGILMLVISGGLLADYVKADADDPRLQVMVAEQEYADALRRLSEATAGEMPGRVGMSYPPD